MEALPVRRKHDRMGLRTGLAIRPELRSSGGKVMTTIFSSSGVGTLPRRAASAVTIMKSILVVEDEPEIARVIRDYLQAAGFTVSVAADGESALQTARISRPDLVVLDRPTRPGRSRCHP